MTLLVLRARRLFDGLADAPSTDQSVVVDGDRIVAVGPADAAPQGPDATVIDLGDATLIPGFVDGHVHLTLHPFATWRRSRARCATKALPRSALAPGLRADMVVLAGDPWRDIVALTQVRQV